MNAVTPKLLVSVGDPVVVLKVTGRANVSLSAAFKALVNELRARGHQAFALDLTECLVMDSTFLGVLAALGSQMSRGAEAGSTCPIVLIEPNDRVRGLLDNLGVAGLFSVVRRPTNGASLQFEEVKGAAASSKLDTTRCCLEAHQFLMAINPANIPKFRDVTAFVAGDLRKLEGG
jgi:anti-anti-sigma regulatory factor